MDKAKANNMPNDNVDRAIKRATDQVRVQIIMKSFMKAMVEWRGCFSRNINR